MANRKRELNERGKKILIAASKKRKLPPPAIRDGILAWLAK
jgi:hypothetical protein